MLLSTTWHTAKFGRINYTHWPGLRLMLQNREVSATCFSFDNVHVCGLRFLACINSSQKWLTRTPSKLSHRSRLCRWLVLPVIILPDGMVQKLLDQRSSPQGAGKRKVSLGRLLYIIGEFGGTEPTLLSLNFTILGGPSNLFAKQFKVSLWSLPYALQT